MDKLKTHYTDKDLIPEAYRDLYSEADGAYTLTGVDESNDIFKLKNALEKERANHKEAKRAIDVMSEKMEALGQQENQEKLVSKREIELLRQESDAHKAEVSRLKTEMKNTTIREKVISAANRSNIAQGAVEDIMMIADRVFDLNDEGDVFVREGAPGFTPGNNVQAWVDEAKEKRPHWWGASQGGGSQGSQPAAAQNPALNPDGSVNFTKLSQLYLEDPDAVKQYFKKV